MNAPNASSKSEEFSLKDIEVVIDSEEQNWFKRAHVGKFLGLPQTEKSLVGLDKCEIRVRNDFDPTHTTARNKTRRINSFHSLGLCMSL